MDSRASAIFDLHRLDVIRRLEAEHLGQEAELAFERPANVLVLPEPMLLPFEQHIRIRQVLLPASLDECLRLVWRDELFFRALEENYRTIHVFGVMDSRPALVDGPRA